MASPSAPTDSARAAPCGQRAGPLRQG
jgi:hypothetical protein